MHKHTHFRRDISFLDFSSLGESNLYVDGIYSPHIHNDDVKYLREIAGSIEYSRASTKIGVIDEFQGARTEFQGVGETEFQESPETIPTFDVKLKYISFELFFEECSGDTSLEDLIVKGLIHWEPREMSCSWIGTEPKDYILWSPMEKKYIHDNSTRLMEIDQSPIGKIELELFERNRVELETSYLKPHSPQKTQGKTIIRTCIPSFVVQEGLVIEFLGVGGITQQHLKDFAVYASYEDIVFNIEFELRHNNGMLCPYKPSVKVKYNKIGKNLEETLFFPIKVSDIPRESYIRTVIRATRRVDGLMQRFKQSFLFMESSSPSGIGWGDYSLYDFQGLLNVYPARTNIQEGNPPNFYLACSDVVDAAHVVLSVKTPLESQIFFKYDDGAKDPNPPTKIRERDWEKIQNDKAPDTLLWKYRKEIRDKIPHKLLSLLKSVDWDRKIYVSGIHKLLQDYPIIHPWGGLEVFALSIEDLVVQEYAVKCLWGLSNAEIISIIPQLIQSIKKEMYICGPLSSFLLTKALSDKGIGYVMYWHIKSEMDDERMFSRFRILKQCYLENIDVRYRREILSIERIFEDLIKIGRLAQLTTLTQEQLRTRLYEIRFPEEGSCLPSSHKTKIKGLIVEECAVLTSKTKPLWLTFEGPKDSRVYAILKVGDDIRVDGLALQMMEILDGLWKREGLDLHLQPYITLPLKQRVGLIQVIDKAETTSTINWKHGGNSFSSAFSSTSLKAFLYKNNIGRDRETAFMNFALSCAGYCVFTYVFGVGDRHGDNIMCTKDGNIFHIDFGYFLGERSKFLGFSRETNYFVLTPNYINAMDTFFDLFVESACSGFAIAQRYENMFSVLIKLMLPCGSDVISNGQLSYVKRALEPWMSEREGKRKFYNIIRKSLQDKRTLFNDFAHLIATRNVKE